MYDNFAYANICLIYCLISGESFSSSQTRMSTAFLQNFVELRVVLYVAWHHFNGNVAMILRTHL